MSNVAIEIDQFSELNNAQHEAVTHLSSPLLVLAGAGTGKTKVLTSKIAYILKQPHIFSNHILAVTFTNKAAKEMQLRVEHMLGQPLGGMFLGTFHSIAARILRRHGERVGLSNQFTIIDMDDQHRLLKQLLKDHRIDEKEAPVKSVSAFIQRWKDRGLTPDKIHLSDIPSIAHGKLLEIYKQYQERLLLLNAADFGDLLLHNLTLFSKHPEILHGYQQQFQYILVDEYQDTNIAQYLWLRLLAEGSSTLCCVGDDDQSIYGWRGAEVGNILRFEQDFANAKIIRLEQNYRSTAPILACASHLIASNEDRLGKTLWTENDDGEKVMLACLWDEREEANFVAAETQRRHEIFNDPLNSMAILVRAGFQTRSFEECFMASGIPYNVIGGLRFYERKEIRDVISYIRFAVQANDDLAFERIINVPKRGIGASSIERIYQHARQQQLSMAQAAASLIENGTIKGKTATGLGKLLSERDEWQNLFDHLPHSDVVQTILGESGYINMWEEDKNPDNATRIENIKELQIAMEEFEHISEFLEHVSLVTAIDMTEDADVVNIMTLHAAKGLEFDTVFLPGWEEGIFPHARSLEEKGHQGMEEERRLAYVGLTRAKKRALISCAASRRYFNQWQSNLPSRFFKELPTEHVEVSSMGKGLSLGIENNPSIKDAFNLGERIFHQKFGYGFITGIQGDQYDIHFEKAGQKTIMLEYLKKV